MIRSRYDRVVGLAGIHDRLLAIDTLRASMRHAITDLRLRDVPPAQVAHVMALQIIEDGARPRFSA